jgi:hypothetical protein
MHFIHGIACVMQSVGEYDDLTHSDTSSHTSWTLENGQMSSHFADMVILVDKWERIPHLGLCTPELVRNWMEDVALGNYWTPFGVVMHLHSTLEIYLFTLDIDAPVDAAEKAKHQKDTIRAKRIIADSIKYHLIPYVSSKKTLKKMFDALNKLYEGNNINRKMNLRTQLKNTRMQKGETI